MVCYHQKHRYGMYTIMVISYERSVVTVTVMNNHGHVHGHRRQLSGHGHDAGNGYDHGYQW